MQFRLHAITWYLQNCKSRHYLPLCRATARRVPVDDGTTSSTTVIADCNTDSLWRQRRTSRKDTLCRNITVQSLPEDERPIQQFYSFTAGTNAEHVPGLHQPGRLPEWVQSRWTQRLLHEGRQEFVSIVCTYILHHCELSAGWARFLAKWTDHAT